MQVVRQNQRRNIPLSVALLFVDFKQQIKGIDQNMATTAGRVENGEFSGLFHSKNALEGI
jgi:hypothetical protein